MSDAASRPGSRGTVLVVEDEPRLVRLIRAVLESGGYRVIVAHDGEGALEQVAVGQPDLVLLDLLLPGSMDGYEICSRLREFSMAPVIMLTARAHEDDKLRGFEAGADDYITKPFSAPELLARVQAVLRRSRISGSPQPIVRGGDVEINLAAHEVTRAGEPVKLSPTELRLLLALARNAGRAMTHEELLGEVWGAQFRNEIDYLRTYVRYLRRKLESDPANPTLLVTVPGAGYRLDASE